VPYERDILEEPWPPRRVVPVLEARTGLEVQDRASGFVGVVTATSTEAVTLRDPGGRSRLFRWKEAGFAVDGRTVSLVRPSGPSPAAAGPRTASGSVKVDHAARVAQASRILVEGVHDAELLEHVWGDDLRHEGLVVEPVGGVDSLPLVVQRFRPGPDRRLGVLVDHLVPGSKESRVAAEVEGPYVLVTGHPFVDVWQAVRPRVAGIDAWPVVPAGRPWKEGVCLALGATDTTGFWRRLRNRVRGYEDLEPGLVGAVEQLLDFLTDPGTH
jgi:hypothetical protein